MSKLQTIILLFSITVLTSGCFTQPKLRGEIKNAQYQYSDIEIDLNYQKLLKCWDQRATKHMVDAENATYSKIYS